MKSSSWLVLLPLLLSGLCFCGGEQEEQESGVLDGGGAFLCRSRGKMLPPPAFRLETCAFCYFYMPANQVSERHTSYQRDLSLSLTHTHTSRSFWQFGGEGGSSKWRMARPPPGAVAQLAQLLTGVDGGAGGDLLAAAANAFARIVPWLTDGENQTVSEFRYYLLQMESHRI